MFEILERGGLGRSGLWTRGGRELHTPLVLSVRTGTRAAPDFAEALLVAERDADPRLQLRASGSHFFPSPVASPDDLPPTQGLPRSVAEMEVPRGTVTGDLAVVSSEADMESARSAEAVFLANAPELLRSPREFVSFVARLREALGPA